MAVASGDPSSDRPARDAAARGPGPGMLRSPDVPVTVALIGDHDPSVTAHRAIPRALRLCARTTGHDVEVAWIGTDAIDPAAPDERLAGFDALWCVPASPYRSMDGAIAPIRYARTEGLPFLGTCGGFQQALIEYARNVLGLGGVGHSEVGGSGAHLIALLSCALVETVARIDLAPGSRLARAYGSFSIFEEYRCSYGLDPAYRHALEEGGVRMVGLDAAGDVRAFELEAHPFYVGTLFQPERAALPGAAPPPVRAFLETAVARPPSVSP